VPAEPARSASSSRLPGSTGTGRRRRSCAGKPSRAAGARGEQRLGALPLGGERFLAVDLERAPFVGGREERHRAARPQVDRVVARAEVQLDVLVAAVALLAVQRARRRALVRHEHAVGPHPKAERERTLGERELVSPALDRQAERRRSNDERRVLPAEDGVGPGVQANGGAGDKAIEHAHDVAPVRHHDRLLDRAPADLEAPRRRESVERELAQDGARVALRRPVLEVGAAEERPLVARDQLLVVAADHQMPPFRVRKVRDEEPVVPARRYTEHGARRVAPETVRHEPLAVADHRGVALAAAGEADRRRAHGRWAGARRVADSAASRHPPPPQGSSAPGPP
jgi:hypothetical protein